MSSRELEQAIAAARAAGQILVAEFGHVHDVRFKGPIDIVTEVDRASETCIVELLRLATPDFGFLLEENGVVAGRTDARWIIDPLDGTVNYAAGYPHYSISIALERDVNWNWAWFTTRRATNCLWQNEEKVQR